MVRRTTSWIPPPVTNLLEPLIFFKISFKKLILIRIFLIKYIVDLCTWNRKYRSMWFRLFRYNHKVIGRHSSPDVATNLLISKHRKMVWHTKSHVQRGNYRRNKWFFESLSKSYFSNIFKQLKKRLTKLKGDYVENKLSHTCMQI